VKKNQIYACSICGHREELNKFVKSHKKKIFYGLMSIDVKKMACPNCRSQIKLKFPILSIIFLGILILGLPAAIILFPDYTMGIIVLFILIMVIFSRVLTPNHFFKSEKISLL